MMATTTMHLRVTQTRVIRSEWIKFWSLRSTIVTIAAALAVVVGIGLLAAQITSTGAAGDTPADPTDVSLAGVGIGVLILGTLGVLFTATEYSTGMIRSTLAAVPKRLPVLWGKAAVFAAVVFPLTLAAALIAFLGGQALLGDHGASLTDPGVARAVLGSAGYLTGAGLFGLALGSLLRSTAAAVSTLFGVLFLLPGISFLLLPDSWQNNVGPYLPSSAGSAFTAVRQSADLLTPWAGLAVFAGYLVVLGGAAAWRLRRHDA
ncbi:ABC transporter permease [Longispora fulva]|uniref:ABC-type transport system involved in multi-copper enzyme maturation permease subunit n=1 Tax=Longispora fulva TaxID=619741 RepID=A0A8J7KDQ5_9ACTN|nr:ABC transporter permease [Longispora fulva]MBG6134295.1 ABC-type transport system involved in multi-copper enzyme maturation permease subunit [Longispora fulva]GIG63009.1 ABC transporter permease [Longispora fulva]